MKDATSSIPSDGLKGLKAHWKSDIVSGFIVFLIALPLSLGIAIASGVPPMAGIISAFVGGMVISLLSGSHVTINGPAAGLIVVVLSSVERLGNGNLQEGYPHFLAATVVAGGFLILMGLAKAGKLGDFFPLSVVHGMLAAIGIIIMSKQIHVMLGVKPHAKGPLALIAEIPHSIATMNPKIALIGVLCLMVMIVLVFFVKNKTIKKIPAPLVAVVIGMLLAMLFRLDSPRQETIFGKSFQVGPEFLVDLPEDFWAGFTFPDFSKVPTLDFWIVVITITLIQGVESLLSASAVEQLDPYKRPTDLNKDIMAVGIGSAVAGFIGGIPIIAEIVRSSANISNGAKTRWSNFFHGLFVFLSVLLIPYIIQLIPLACLASLLVITGFRLASPKEFAHVYHLGKDQFIIFTGTIVGILATDLLKGVLIGLFIKILIGLYYGINLRNLFKANLSIQQRDNKTIEVSLAGSITFSNYLSVKEKIARLPLQADIFIDFTNVSYLDHSSLERLLRMRQDRNLLEQGKIYFVGLELLKPTARHHLSSRVKSATELVSVHHLSQRQQNIATMASKNGYAFSCTAEPYNTKLKKFNYFSTTRLSHELNFIHGLIDQQTDFHVSDIVVFEKGVLEKNHTHTFTAIFVQHLPYHLPDFMLEKEYFIDKIMANFGYQDIDFTEFPKFSSAYRLSGKDENKIREFFTPSLLRLLEDTPVYYMEAKASMLFVQPKEGVLSASEIENLIKFTRQFLSLGVKQATRV